jgi:hypothetical protein
MAAERDSALRLRAFLTGKPVARLECRPLPVVAARDRMLAVFLRMGGESSPWAIAWKRGKAKAEFRSVPEARRRTDVAGMVAEFGDALCGHFESADGALRQLWIPGGTHAEMLHFVALRYTKAKKAEAALLPRLNRTGRRCNQLFDSTQNPNSALCVDATVRLKELFAFPCEPIRENHLGFLLAWLGNGAGSARAKAAKAAEALSVSTSLDPEIERSMVSDVEGWNDAASDAARDRHAARIHNVLESELRRRLELLETAIAAYDDAASENPGAQAISNSSMQEMARFDSSEDFVAQTGIVRSPETDHSPTTAAMSYAYKDADMIAARAALVPFDRACQEELVAEGSAFRGDVISIGTVTIGVRTLRTQAVVATDGGLPLRLRESDSVVVAGDLSGKGVWKITQIDDDPKRAIRTITLVAQQATPTGPPLKRGSAGIVFHEKLDAELRRRLATMVSSTKSMAADGLARGAWILEKLAEREATDSAPDVEQFDGTNTKVVPDA